MIILYKKDQTQNVTQYNRTLSYVFLLTSIVLSMFIIMWTVWTISKRTTR